MRSGIMVRNPLYWSLMIILALAVSIIMISADSSARTYEKKQITIDDKINEQGYLNVIISPGMMNDAGTYNDRYGLQTTTDRQKVNAASRAARNAANNAALNAEYRDIIANSGFKISKELSIINGYAGTIDRKSLKKLRARTADSGIEINVYEDKPLKIIASQQENDLSDSISILSNRSMLTIGANYSYYTLNLTGRGVNVAVIDTGIDYYHPDLGGCFNESLGHACKVSNGYDFYNNDSDPMDDNGHGTHMAGIIGANGTMRGIAPDVSLYALKVCDSSGQICNTSLIIEAIQWAVDNGADIISLSLGDTYSDVTEGNSGKDPISSALDEAAALGLTIIAAAGNHGPGISTLEVPGAAADVITVTAVDDMNTLAQDDDTLWNGSSLGPSAFGRLDPDISAPGFNITSTVPNGSCSNCHSSRYRSITGTSTAVPHVVGVAALMLEDDPALLPSEIRNIMMGTAANITGKIFEKGTGVISIPNIFNNMLSVIVASRDTYGHYVDNDRWEFISPVEDYEYANITVSNNFDFGINFTVQVTALDNMESALKINSSRIGIISNFSLNSSDNTVISINFSLENHSREYATTYGGMILLIGTNASGVQFNWSIPVIITVPILNHAYIQRNFTNTGSSNGDVLFYAYYNENAGNETISIICDDAESNDFDLYVYNSTGYLDDYAGYNMTTQETVTTLLPDSIKWFRIHGYDFNPSPFVLNITITDNDNNAPIIYNFTDISNSTDMNFTSNENITIRINYHDLEDDAVDVSINDSRYSIIESGIDYAVFSMENNASLSGIHTVNITLTDAYDDSASETIAVEINDVIISAYTPETLSFSISRGTIANFTHNSSDLQNRSLSYYWYVNNVLNATTQNFSINTSTFNRTYYVMLVVSNNISNSSITWALAVDDIAPSVSIQYPESMIYEGSEILLNYTVSDDSSVSKCWYRLNSSNTNTTIASCANTTLYLASRSYNLTVYANDTFRNIGSASIAFGVDDNDEPVMSNPLPNRSFSSSTSSVTLNVTTDEYADCRYDTSDIDYSDMHNMDDYITRHTLSYSVTSGRNYTVYVKCRDLSGNTNEDPAVIQFSVKARTSSPGPGPGSTPTPPRNTSSTSNITYYRNFILRATDSINLSINRNNIAFTRIDASINRIIDNVDISIEQFINTNARSQAALLPQDIIRNALILVNHTNVLDDDINYVTIRFRVSKSWISDNSIDINSITLFRFDSVWEPLLTYYVTEDPYNYYYQAESLGLSLFMITGEPIQPITDGLVGDLDDLNEERDYYDSIYNITNNESLLNNSRKPGPERPLSILNDSKQENAQEILSKLKIMNYIFAFIIVSIIAISIVMHRMYEQKSRTVQAKVFWLNNRYMQEARMVIMKYQNMARYINPSDPKALAKRQFLIYQYSREIRMVHDKYQNAINMLKQQE